MNADNHHACDLRGWTQLAVLAALLAFGTASQQWLSAPKCTYQRASG
jgi:hypothetical protein